MNQLYNQVSGHTVGYIGFITNYMANYLNAVSNWGDLAQEEIVEGTHGRYFTQ